MSPELSRVARGLSTLDRVAKCVCLVALHQSSRTNLILVAGDAVVLRRTDLMSPLSVKRRRCARSTVARTSLSSKTANEAPRQRREPLPQ
jgi:hypothetical protein